MSKIIQNAIRIIDCNHILWSKSIHDYQEYNGYSIDGGNHYVNLCYPVDKLDNIEMLVIYDNDPIESSMKKLIWGTYGKSGKEPLKIVKLFDCESEHLNNILKNMTMISDYTKINILHILEYRRLQNRKEKILKIKKLYER